MNNVIISILVFELIFCQNIYDAADYLTRNSCKSSKGLCAKYVANALQYGGKFTFNRQSSAYMYHSNGILNRIGFREIGKPNSFKVGDITVTEKNKDHEHGHIAMWNGNQWISDFRQKSEFVYSKNQPKVHYYRYGSEDVIDNSGFSIGQEGINLITYFEGCRLTAYFDKHGGIYTIGYGHTGNDVYKGLTITKEKAVNLLKQDLKEHEKYVKNRNYVTIQLNQNQFDALTSFTYNLGPKNLKELCYGKSASQIANEITLYNLAGKGANREVLPGLTKRRNAERNLFLKSEDSTPTPIPTETPDYISRFTPLLRRHLKFTYAVRISTGKILPEVVNDNDYAGKIGTSITDIAIKVNAGSIKYRVHVKGGKWLKFVTGYN